MSNKVLGSVLVSATILEEKYYSEVKFSQTIKTDNGYHVNLLWFANPPGPPARVRLVLHQE